MVFSILMNIIAIAGSYVGIFVESFSWFGWVVFGIALLRVVIDFIKLRSVWYLVLIFSILIPAGVAFSMSLLMDRDLNFVTGFCFLFSIFTSIFDLYYIILGRFGLLGDTDDD